MNFRNTLSPGIIRYSSGNSEALTAVFGVMPYHRTISSVALHPIIDSSAQFDQVLLGMNNIPPKKVYEYYLEGWPQILLEENLLVHTYLYLTNWYMDTIGGALKNILWPWNNTVEENWRSLVPRQDHFPEFRSHEYIIFFGFCLHVASRIMCLELTLLF